MIIRLARPEDVPGLAALVERSVRGLVAREYDARQIESSLRHLFGVDTRIIADGTYFVAEVRGRVVGCGGWSRRRTPFGGDQASEVQDAGLRDPGRDPAVIRAFFVDPEFAGRGVGSAILDASESAARRDGYRSFELVATLSGVAFYAARGYVERDPLLHTMPDGVALSFVRMVKPASP